MTLEVESFCNFCSLDQNPYFHEIKKTLLKRSNVFANLFHIAFFSIDHKFESCRLDDINMIERKVVYISFNYL